MKAEEELFILTGKASYKYKLNREEELVLFALLNVSNYNGALINQLEYTVNFCNDFNELKQILICELYDSLNDEFEEDEE